MNETVDSEMLKTVSGLTYILRWEDDGGAVFEIHNLLPRVAEANTDQAMEVAGVCLSYLKHDK